MKKTCLALMLALPLSVFADWKLDNDHSRLSFVTIKKGTAGEVGRFKRMEGEVSSQGQVGISIDLTSVDTAVEIRDERMQSMLFETGMYPKATLSAQLDGAKLKAMKAGDMKIETVKAELDLHGIKKSLDFEVAISKLANDKLLVISNKPVVIAAADFGLDAGVEKLRAVAELPSISQAVPVSFILSFSGGM